MNIHLSLMFFQRWKYTLTLACIILSSLTLFLAAAVLGLRDQLPPSTGSLGIPRWECSQILGTVLLLIDI